MGKAKEGLGALTSVVGKGIDQVVGPKTEENITGYSYREISNPDKIVENMKSQQIARQQEITEFTRSMETKSKEKLEKAETIKDTSLSNKVLRGGEKNQYLFLNRLLKLVHKFHLVLINSLRIFSHIRY